MTGGEELLVGGSFASSNIVLIPRQQGPSLNYFNPSSGRLLAIHTCVFFLSGTQVKNQLVEFFFFPQRIHLKEFMNRPLYMHHSFNTILS